MEESITTCPLTNIIILYGIISVLVALLLRFLKPKSPNWIYGYRSRRSMASQEAWDHAQQFASKLSLQYGLASMAFSSIGFIWHTPENWGIGIGLIWIVGVSILLIYKVESELKRKFGSN